MDESRHVQSPRLRRIDRTVSLVLTIVSAALAVYWLIKWLRGDSNEYRNEIAGGLTLTTAMTLLTSAGLVRTATPRWTLLGTGAILIALNLAVILVGARMSLLTVIALLLIAGSIVRTAHVLWPARGVSFTQWKTMPTTLEQRRVVCVGMATFSLGAAVFSVSLFDLTRGPWQATAVAVFTTLMFLGTAVLFLVLRSRLRG